MSDFCHLHCHTEYSAWDGLSTVKEVVGKVKADGQTAVAFTEHGNCAVHPDAQIVCDSEDVKAIFGIEAYFVDDRFDRGESGKKVTDYWHLVLWAMDDEGLKNLWAMSTESYRDGLWGKYARLDWDTLQRLNKGVMCSTACLGGPVMNPLIHENEELATSNLLRLHEIFGDRLYAEVQTGMQMEQVYANAWLLILAERYGIEPVVTCDSHYPSKEDKHDHRIWLAATMSKTLEDLADSKMFSGDDTYHVATEAEVRHSLRYLDRFSLSEEEYGEIPVEVHENMNCFQFSAEFSSGIIDRLIANTKVIADRCTARIELTSRNPIYSRITEENPDPLVHDRQVLLDWCLQRWDERTVGKSRTQAEYMARFENEFGMIADKGFAGYFLIVADIVSWAKKNGILVGPGRGSGGGSLVAYLLGITEIDPVQHDVLFERFMTKGRTELPDFDIDFPSSKKAAVYGYVAQRWGEPNVATVSTHMRLKSKSVIQSVAKAIKSELPENHWLDIMACSAIIEAAEGDTAGLGLSWEDLWDRAGEELQPYADKYPRLFKLAGHFHGRLKGYGKHPAGVIIDPDHPLTENLPLRMGEDGQLIAQFDLKVLELLGFVKFDLLNIANLDMIQTAMDLIFERTGRRINPYAWIDELEDPLIYDRIGAGHTLGLFQIGSAIGTQMSRRMKPQNLHELADMVTLVRPGPSRSGLTDRYLARRAGEEEVTYLDPRLEPVFGKTWAAMIYQEQLMRACMVMAGYDDVQADKVRKILGKKKVEAAKVLGVDFIEKAIANNTDESVARELWAQMEEFARYCVAGDTRIHLAASGPHSDGTVAVAELHRRLHSKLPAYANAGTSAGVVGRPKSTFTGPCVCCGEFAKSYIRGYCTNKCEAWLRKFHTPTKGLYALGYFADGRIRPAQVLDVVESGEQELFRVTLESGHALDATAGHRHLTSVGYREVRELAVGDQLMIDLGYEAVREGRRLTVGERRRAGSINGAHGEDNHGFIDGGHATWQAWRETHDQVCVQCASRENVQQAHLNGDEKDNRPENFAWLCQPCHSRYDYAVNDRRRRWQKGHLTGPSRIVSIESIGIEMTYDVVMEAPHNFVANGIITHNSFGFAHALAYAILAVWTAWFKFHFPLYFLCGALTYAGASSNSGELIPAFVEETRRMGYRVLPPDINLSGRGFALGNTGLDIRYGLDAIKGVGAVAVEAILAAQPFTSWEDFLERRGSKVNAGHIRTMVRLGVFDSLEPNRKVLEARLEFEALPAGEQCQHRVSSERGLVWLPTPKKGAPQEPESVDWTLPCSFDWEHEPDTTSVRTGKLERRKAPPKKCSKACRQWAPAAGPEIGELVPYTDAQIRTIEQEMLGVYLSSTPFDLIPDEDKERFATADDVQNGPNGSYAVAAVVQGFRPARNRDDMGFVQLVTPRGSLSVVAFPSIYEQYGAQFIKGTLAYTLLSKNDKGCSLTTFIPIDQGVSA